MTAGELIVDSFAGGGGASIGIARALGRSPDIAINHDAAAIAMHAANHPQTVHYTEDVWKVSPRAVTQGRPVGLLWASPDCRHFSRAKGGKPVEKNIRSLAWVVVKWAAECAPRVIILENVREFEDWGPLLPVWRCVPCNWRGTEGQAKLARRGRRACPRCESVKLIQTEDMLPDPNRKGLTFRRFVGRLRNLGYAVAWKVLNAADYGAPTHRRRLFLVARNDGQPIVWPEPTHGDPKKIGEPSLFGDSLKPWRTAAECIDWSIPCPSIFDRKKPLAEKTLRRIALGIKRYVLENPRPFIVYMHRGNRPRGVDEPCGTVTTQGNKFNLVTPVLAPLDQPPYFRHICETEGGDIIRESTSGRRCKVCGKKPERPEPVATPIVVPVTHAGDRRSYSPEEPLPTVTGANRGELVAVTPVIARMCQSGGNGKYCNGADEPLTSIVSKAEHLLVAPVLSQLAHGGKEPSWSESRSKDLGQPIGTVHAGGNNHALVSAFLAKHFGGVVGVPVNTPLPTTTARGTQTQLAVANLVHLNHGEKTSSGCDEPARTVTAGGNHAALVYSFLMKYFGSGGQWSALDAPAPTATTKDRIGLVTVSIDGEPYVIVDIGMRMLMPRELARAQGFEESYILTGTKTSQVERIGNSVPPDLAEAVVRANCVAGLAVAA